MMTFDELKALIDQRGVHPVFGGAGEFDWGIEQSSAELAKFLVVCQELGVASVLEVGTGYRAGLARFLHDDLQWRVTSVDVQDYGHQYAGITFITGIIAEFEYPVFEGKFDLVLIDGDHTYDAVHFDHDYYAKYASKVIAFHDICGLRDCQGVRQYWQEISYAATVAPGYYEIIADGDQRSGIGYIVLAEVVTPALVPHHDIEETLTLTKDDIIHTWELPDGAEFAKGTEDKPADVKPPAKPKPTRKPAAKKPTAAKKTAVKK